MRKLACIFVLGACAVFGVSQEVSPAPVQQNPPTNTVQGIAGTTIPYQQKPTEPQGFPGLPQREGPLPPPQPPTPNDRQVRILQAGTILRNGNLIKITGGAHVQYRGYDITASEVDGDLNTEIFDSQGDVHVQGADAVITGDRVRVNYRDQTYRAWDTNAQIQPSLTGGALLDALYTKSKESFGSQREIFTFDSDFTTCNYLDPHFYVEAKRSVIRPNKRAIFHDLKLVVLHHTILKLPFLSVPLNQPTYRYVPEVGRDPVDGYYVKTRYGIPLQNPADNLDARVDYFQKLGNGLGGDYTYAGKAMAGLLSLYGISGISKTIMWNAQHQQAFKWGSLALDTNYQKNDVASAPGQTSLNTRLQFQFPRGLNNTSLSLFEANNSSAGFSAKQQTITLGDTRAFGPNLKTNLNVADVANDAGTVQQQQVNVNLGATDDLKKAVAQFNYQRSIPVGTIQNFFSSSDQTPVVTLSSDSTRLLGPKAWRNLPFTTDLSVGNYIDAVSNDHITRSAFDFGFQRLDNSLKRSHFTADGKFSQGVYSDNTAQYTLGLDTVYSYTLGPDTSLNLRYNYLRPEGFSPLVIDQTGITNLVSGDVSVRPWHTFLVGLQSGYDIQALHMHTGTPYQFVGVRTEYTPANWLSLRTQETYDPVQKLWNSARVDLAYRPGATFVSIGAQYDGQRQVWGSTNMFIDGLKWGRMKASTILQYNGYTKRFLTQQYSFTYDLHCAEAVLQVLDNETGFNPGRQVVFFLRIKALPFESPFGTGSFGQALGTGGGVRF